MHVDGETLDADQLLVAAGRSNNLADVGLETVGLDPEADTVEIDERMRAGERLWAVGDITGKGAFTHVSRYQAAGAVADILGKDGPPADYRAVSRVTFTDPELASVGLTEGAGPRGRALGPGRAGATSSGPAGAGCTARAPPAWSSWSRTPTAGCWWAPPSWRRTAAR